MQTAYVINLDKNLEKWELLRESWKNAFPLERVSAIEASPGWIGCARSHLNCIREAKQRGDKNVLVWEDDCVPRVRSGESMNPRVIAKLWKDLMVKLSNSTQWDIVIGATSAAQKGASFVSELSTPELKVFRLEHGFTTHWTLYNHTIFDKMLEWDEKQPIDVYMYKHAKVHVTLPFLAEQRQGWSDIELRQADYHSWFNSAEQMIRTIEAGKVHVPKQFKVIP